MSGNGAPIRSVHLFGQEVRKDRKAQKMSREELFDQMLAHAALKYPDFYESSNLKMASDGEGVIGRVERGTMKTLRAEMAVSICGALRSSATREAQLLSLLGIHRPVDTEVDDIDFRVFLITHAEAMYRVSQVLGKTPTGKIKLAHMDAKSQRQLFRSITIAYCDFMDLQS